MKLPRIALAAAALAGAGAANAATLVYTSDPVDWTDTNFNRTLKLQQFDSSFGTLTAAKVTLHGALAGLAQAENLSPSSEMIWTLMVNATLTLAVPVAGDPLVLEVPVANRSINFGVYDGVLDFGGSSGATFPYESVEASASQTLTTLADLALFTGAGFVEAGLAASAVDRSSSNNGNLVWGVTTQASGYATVEYTYDDAPPVAPVPEPSTWALMVLGIGMAGISARRRTPPVSA